MCYHAANFQAGGELPKRQGSGAAMIVPYRGYATRDGFIVIAAGNDKLFASLARVLGHPEWAADARFKTNPDRVKNQAVLYGWIEEIVRERTNQEWQALLDEAEVPNAPDAIDRRRTGASADRSARHDAGEPEPADYPARSPVVVRWCSTRVSQGATIARRAHIGSIRHVSPIGQPCLSRSKCGYRDAKSDLNNG